MTQKITPEATPEKEKYLVYDDINGDFEEVDGMDGALQYAKDSFTDDVEGLHPEFKSLPVYHKVGSIDVVIGDKGWRLEKTLIAGANWQANQATPVKRDEKLLYPLSIEGLEDMLEDFTIDHLKETGYSVGSESDCDKTYDEKNKRIKLAYDIILNGIPATPAIDKSNEAELK